MKKIPAGRLAIGALACCLAHPAFAADDSYSYPYAGVSLGQSKSRIDADRITAELLSDGAAVTSITRDERDFGFKAFGGYQFNRYIGLEAGYFNLGQFRFKSTTLPSGTLEGELKLQGFNLDLVGTLPLSDHFSVIGRAGAQYAMVRDRFTSSGAIVVLDPNPSENKVNYKFGAGLQYEVVPSFLLRAEAERYRINDAVGNRGDVDLYSLGVVIPFGRQHTPPAPPAPVAYVAPPAPAEPPPVVAPAPVVEPVRRRVSFSADSLFAFNRAEISVGGRQALDTFVAKLAGSTYDVITVEGYTDRLGSEAYNQKLSVRRAEAVKAYLVSPGGIDPGKISAVGKGMTNPITKPDECPGKEHTAKLIACLQPDRRVEVEVVGTHQ